MSTVISLNKARKRKNKADAEQQAAENRVRFGRTKEEKAREAADAALQAHKLNLLRRDPTPNT